MSSIFSLKVNDFSIKNQEIPISAGLFWLLLLLMVKTALMAAYLENVPILIRQPDGQEIQCFATGDEFYNWLHDSAGYTIVKNPRSGFYVYAQKSKGTLVPTDYIVGRIDPSKIGLTPGLNISGEQIKQLRSASLLVAQENIVEKRPSPKIGSFENLVVFIRFADEPEFTDSIADYENSFNSSTNGAISVSNYMREISYNQLLVHSSFYPIPSGATVVSYQDVHPRGYYKPKSDDPLGYANSFEQSWREQTLVMNAVMAIRSQVPIDLNLDGDNDGYVDNMIFIISGSPTAWNTLLWPHAWVLYMYYVTINGKRVYGYNLQLQSFLAGGQIHVICHELLHTIGFPDLYHYSGDGLHPVERWDIMASPTSPPQHPCAYSKFKYGQWITNPALIEGNGAYVIKPLTQPDSNCYKIFSPNDPSGKQYFFVEYRRKSPLSFDRALPSEGVLVYRIDNRDPSQQGNATPPDEIYIYRPGGTPTTNGDVSRATFAADHNRTAINDYTDPSCFLADGSPGGLDLFGVSALGERMSFQIGHSVPSAPLLMAPANFATGVSLEVVFNWSSLPGVSGFHLQVAPQMDFSTPLYDVQAITANSFSIANLDENKGYYWRVRAFNSKGYGEWSEIWQFSTRGVPPQPPGGVKVTGYYPLK